MKPTHPSPVPEVQSATYEIKWSARVDSFFSAHPYRCQVCSLDGEQRPEGANTGPIRLYRLSDSWAPGDEPDDSLASLCKHCARETRFFTNTSGEPWLVVVQRFTLRHKRSQRRRRDTITKQIQERQHRRVRKQEWRGKLDQFKAEGVPVPREFFREYADVYEYL